MTDDHEKRLEQQEVERRKHWRWLLLSLTTALGAGGGTGAKALIDAETNDQFRTVVAQRAATDDQRWKQADKERERLIAQVDALRETVAGLKATVEMLARNRTQREAVKAITLPAPAKAPAQRASAPVEAATVQKMKVDLFGK